MLSAAALPILVQQLESSSGTGWVRRHAASILADLCQDPNAAAAAALQHGAVPPLVAALRRAQDPVSQCAAVVALEAVAKAPQATGLLLRSGAVEAIVPLLLSGSAGDRVVQQHGAIALGELAFASEARGLAVLAARSGSTSGARRRLSSAGAPDAAWQPRRISDRCTGSDPSSN